MVTHQDYKYIEIFGRGGLMKANVDVMPYLVRLKAKVEGHFVFVCFYHVTYMFRVNQYRKFK